MNFFRRAAVRSPERHRVAVFPGSFNPITKAHVALAGAALDYVHEVVFTLPTSFPHKPYQGASFEDRIAMLIAASQTNPAFSVAASQRGLYLEIAQECRAFYGDVADISFLCGRDAAERILHWDYPNPESLTEFLSAHRLLVAARDGEFAPPERFASTITQLPLARDWSEVSASEIRSRIAQNLPWEHLAPPGAHAHIRRIYSRPETVL